MTPKEAICTRCHIPKPQTEENFCRDKRKEGIGYFTVCRECTRAREKEKYDRKKKEISYF